MVDRNKSKRAWEGDGAQAMAARPAGTCSGCLCTLRCGAHYAKFVFCDHFPYPAAASFIFPRSDTNLAPPYFLRHRRSSRHRRSRSTPSMAPGHGTRATTGEQHAGVFRGGGTREMVERYGKKAQTMARCPTAMKLCVSWRSLLREAASFPRNLVDT